MQMLQHVRRRLEALPVGLPRGERASAAQALGIGQDVGGGGAERRVIATVAATPLEEGGVRSGVFVRQIGQDQTEDGFPVDLAGFDQVRDTICYTKP